MKNSQRSIGKRVTLFVILILQVFYTMGQKEASVWCFGSGSGLDFTDTIVKPIISDMVTLEGCSSIADKDGHLLFYTDGVSVWNRNHQQMPNGSGLLGFSSSTQSALIIRKPGSSFTYYVFTADGTSSAMNHHMENGYRYSTVDMSMAGGLGDVTTIKNQLLYAPSTEKLAAVKHADGVGIWVMTHEWNSSRFRAYHVTCSGLDTNAVISISGDSHDFNSGFYNEAIGQMKFSPDGKKLAVVNQGKSRVQIFDFDNQTGIVSNPVNILSYWTDQYLQPSGVPYDFENLYGVEFSPNSRLLYLTCIGSLKLFQYDLSQKTPTGISATGVYFPLSPWCITSGGVSHCPATNGGLQLGPDGKIYGAYKPFFGLNVIEKPNLFGPVCNYIRSDSLLRLSNYGLPSFLASYFDEGLLKEVDQVCASITMQTKLGNTSSYYWDFGDPASSTNSSTAQKVTHTYTKSGQYMIKLIQISSAGCSDTLRHPVQIKLCGDTAITPEPIEIPNVFTPNGDGINDVFLIKNIEHYSDSEVAIFDRWGMERFREKNYTINNAFDGSNCNNGVYYYTVVIPSIQLKYHGYFTLLR